MIRLLNEDQGQEINIIPKSEIDDENIKIENDEVEIDIASEKASAETENARIYSYKETINALTKGFWELISHTEAVVATIKYDFDDEIKDDTLNILEGVLNDLTIDLGMLSKISSLIDEKDASKTIELMAKGEEKADKIINKK